MKNNVRKWGQQNNTSKHFLLYWDKNTQIKPRNER